MNKQGRYSLGIAARPARPKRLTVAGAGLRLATPGNPWRWRSLIGATLAGAQPWWALGGPWAALVLSFDVFRQGWEAGRIHGGGGEVAGEGLPAVCLGEGLALDDVRLPWVYARVHEYSEYRQQRKY